MTPTQIIFQDLTEAISDFVGDYAIYAKLLLLLLLIIMIYIGEEGRVVVWRVCSCCVVVLVSGTICLFLWYFVDPAGARSATSFVAWMDQHWLKRRSRGGACLSSSVAVVPSSSLPSVPQEPVVPASLANVPSAIVPIVCAHEPASLSSLLPSVPQVPVVPSSDANVPDAIVPASSLPSVHLPVVPAPPLVPVLSSRAAVVSSVPAPTTITIADVDHLCDAFEALSLLDVDADLAPIFDALTVADMYNEDVYMRPPVDVHYQEPLWVAAMRLSDLMDVSDDMDASFSPLLSPMIIPLSPAPGAPVDDAMDVVDDMDLTFSPLPSPLVLPLSPASGVPVDVADESILANHDLPLTLATPFITLLTATATTTTATDTMPPPPPSSPSSSSTSSSSSSSSASSSSSSSSSASSSSSSSSSASSTPSPSPRPSPPLPSRSAAPSPPSRPRSSAPSPSSLSLSSGVSSLSPSPVSSSASTVLYDVNDDTD